MLEKLQEEVLKKFQAIKGTVLIGREPIKGTQQFPKVPKDEYVSEEHLLHDLIRGLYKPGGKPYILSYLATESEENYGKQIKWKNREKYDFETIIMRPPSSEKDNRKNSDISAARYNLKNGIPIGILYKLKERHNVVLGLGKIINEDKDGNFIVKPFSFEQENKSFMLEEVQSNLITVTTLIDNIVSYIDSKGFEYKKQSINNLYLSLRSKPFVILSGISGTGKTKIVQLFANAVGANYENGRYRLISVRPNWSDSSDLLGYTDLKGDFVCGQLTDMIIRAANDPEYPYFVVLDEMNLARVEYYLSDYLSVIESRDWQDDGIETSPIVQVKDEDCDEKREYGLPENLYIIGTVNMDETTYPFSKKVLDRANSIEFNDINLKAYMTKPAEQNVEPIEVSNKYFVSEYLYFKDIYPQHEGIIDRVSTQLEKMNEQLKEIYAHVGYRVRDEICFYMIYAQDTDLTEDEAMDFCVMQKILPRISGAGEEIEKLLKVFYQDFAGIAYDEKGVVPAEARYPRSAKKVAEMLKRLRIQGFTSFWAS